MDDDTYQHPAHHKRLLRPLVATERSLERFVDWLGSLALFQLLEYAGRLTVLVAVIFYFVEAPERRKQTHYQAWQLINSAQGQTGSGGRIEALQDLNEDHVSLAALAAPKANLAGINLRDAHLRFANLSGTIFEVANLQGADLIRANLQGADFDTANLQGADLTQANLRGADFEGANLQRATVQGADLQGADLHGADLRGADLRGANLQGADLIRANLQGANLATDQIKAANNWERATYDDSFRAQLGLPATPTARTQP